MLMTAALSDPLAIGEVAKIVASGVFPLARKNGKSKFFGLLGSSDVFRFIYGIMYNARLFLSAFQKLLNIKIA